MNNFLSILFFGLIVFGCNSDDEKIQAVDPNKVDLNKLAGISAVTSVEASLRNTSGEPMDDIEQLQPNTEYYIVLEGEGADFLRISYGHIFEILDHPESQSSNTQFIYKIKTSADFADRILINVVPLHENEGQFLRERTQVHFLPY